MMKENHKNMKQYNGFQHY